MKDINIGDFKIGGNHAFIIAEVGNNHNGDFDRALKMIDQAVEIGADCVKFQLRHIEEVYRRRSLEKGGEDLGTEYVVDLLNRFELSKDEHRKLYEYCEKKNILYLCTPWDLKSLEFLEELNVKAYKVASADLTNIPLISNLCKTKKPLILSTGMSTEEEIKSTVVFLNNNNANYVLLHCNSTYPAPYHDINLSWMRKLSEIHPFIGYSGHERGTAVTFAARTLGASVIERHFTLDRMMEGPDHAASLERDEFEGLVKGIRQIEEAMGDGKERSVSQGEMINRENLAKSLVASEDLKEGTILTEELIDVRSPGQGLSPQFFDQLVGKKINRNMQKEDFFFLPDITGDYHKPKDYLFKRPWGVPVRYHDFDEYSAQIKPDLYEFHLSYSDMELKLNEYLHSTYTSNFVVHAPELFSNSRLMDLTSPDSSYREDSIHETQRVVDITRELKSYFPNTERPMIVANIGGFTMDNPLPRSEVTAYYERFGDSLTKLDLEGVELIPQTMAPFPWHFGGQRYQNLFVYADEINEWCKKLDLRICFDISHTALTCNHNNLDLYQFAEQIAALTAHIHLGDAKGVNGEGLQIGEGDLDFKRLSKILDKECPEASFIPEIWQGHKNAGEGFWIALEKLENYF